MGSTGSQWDEESVDQMMMMMMMMMMMLMMIMMIMIMMIMINSNNDNDDNDNSNNDNDNGAIRLDYLKERVSQKNKRYYLRVVRRTISMKPLSANLPFDTLPSL